MTMTATPAFALPWGRPLIADDLENLPDDGHRYELIDGVLVVTPGPNTDHQGALGRLYMLFQAEAPPELLVLFAVFDVKLANDTVMQPDLLVARRSDLTDRNLPTAPVLALEVLSKSTRSFDLLVKKERFARAGCEHYWVLDPIRPAITAWRLEKGEYVVAGEAVRDERMVVESPFHIEVCPDEVMDY